MHIFRSCDTAVFVIQRLTFLILRTCVRLRFPVIVCYKLGCLDSFYHWKHCTKEKPVWLSVLCVYQKIYQRFLFFLFLFVSFRFNIYFPVPFPFTHFRYFHCFRFMYLKKNKRTLLCLCYCPFFLLLLFLCFKQFSESIELTCLFIFSSVDFHFA